MDEVIYRGIQFIKMKGDRFSAEEQKEMFINYMRRVNHFLYSEICADGDELLTIITRKVVDGEEKYIIFRDDGWEGWYQDEIILLERDLLKVISK